LNIDQEKEIKELIREKRYNLNEIKSLKIKGDELFREN
jgi:DNA-dependent RNA polymerase auxiliary subunit epsilon